MGRKYFGTDGVRGRANVHPMTAEFAVKLEQPWGITLQKAPSITAW